MAENVRAATAELARVVDVDIKQYTCTLQTENSNKPLSFVPFASPYCNNPEGEGMTFVPEVGSQAILLHANEGPVIIGFIMTPGEDLYRGNRPVPKPGDIFASTRDGNFLHLHRGGVVQIGATPTTQRLYVPIDRLIRDICQNYHLETFGGALTWEVETEDVKDPTALFKLRGYELATDKDASVTLKIGRAFEPDEQRKDMDYQPPSSMKLSTGLPGYIELEINKEQKNRTFLLRVDQAGNEFLDSQGGYERRHKGKCFLRMDDDFMHEVSGGYSLGVGVPAPTGVDSGNLHEKVLANTTRECAGAMTDSCLTRVVDAGEIKLGSATAYQPVVLGYELIKWLGTHTHVPGPGPLPLNPADLARLKSILSSTVFSK